MDAKDPQDLLNQADQALYAAKRGGRNRVARWNDIPQPAISAEPSVTATLQTPRLADPPIPFHAVNALLTALAHRNKATAEHSKRVADLCLMASHGRMTMSECFTLEMAALLHDLGKLGIPDAILFKPGPLTNDEWTVMSSHDKMSAEIVAAAFASHELTEIVRLHHAWFDGQSRDAALPSGAGIPVGARILAIADAYDAMVSDRVYRKARTDDEACAELRHWAGRQFDPELVEHFIYTLGVSQARQQKPLNSMLGQTTLLLRLQIERLACAVDARDIATAASTAADLVRMASKDSQTRIAELAGAIEQSKAGDGSLPHLIELTNELLGLCRSAQAVDAREPQETMCIAAPSSL